MTNKSIISLAVILAAATATICVGHLLASPRPPQDQTARCAVVVPKRLGRLHRRRFLRSRIQR
jgi:hypothetical protein